MAEPPETEREREHRMGRGPKSARVGTASSGASWFQFFTGLGTARQVVGFRIKGERTGWFFFFVLYVVWFCESNGGQIFLLLFDKVVEKKLNCGQIQFCVVPQKSGSLSIFPQLWMVVILIAHVRCLWNFWVKTLLNLYWFGQGFLIYGFVKFGSTAVGFEYQNLVLGERDWTSHIGFGSRLIFLSSPLFLSLSLSLSLSVSGGSAMASLSFSLFFIFFFFPGFNACLLFTLSCHAAKFEQRNRMYRMQATACKFCPKKFIYKQQGTNH